MGAWGIQFDENDDAADWLADFADAPGWSAIDQTFAAVEADYVEAPDASAALAAAEVVAAALGRPSLRLDDSILEWATQHAQEGKARQPRALKALTRIRDESELSELWRETDKFTDWQSSVNQTIARL